MIPFLDLEIQYRNIAVDLNNAATRVLQSGRYILGEHVRIFEEEFARYCGATHAVGVSSGTSALHLALLAAGVGPGDEVITVPATFVATVAAIEYAGATVKLVDVDPWHWTMDTALLEAAITPRTKVVLPVHLHGRLANMEQICAIARAHGLLVIEDAAQAHGAELNGRRAGTFGDIGCFSFYPGKNLGACGDAGAIVTNNAELAHRVRTLRDWGQVRKGVHALKGFNDRLDEIQAALLSVKLRHLEDWTNARRQAATRYNALLAGSGIRIPAPMLDLAHCYHVYAVLVEQREAVQRQMLAASVQTGIHYGAPVHLQPAYANLGYGAGDFPVSEAIARQTLSLPMFPELTTSQIDAVCAALIEACVSDKIDHVAAD